MVYQVLMKSFVNMLGYQVQKKELLFKQGIQPISFM